MSNETSDSEYPIWNLLILDLGERYIFKILDMDDVSSENRCTYEHVGSMRHIQILFHAPTQY